MINIDTIVRPNILALAPYSSARDEYTGKNGILLDANENPYGTLNRYPDPYQKKLKEKLAKLKDVHTNNIFVGNGSDEVIDLTLRIFCRPGFDKALTFSPTYGMYDVLTAINHVELLKLPLNREFQIDIEKLQPYIKDASIKVICICSPNNPTGNSMPPETIAYILGEFNGIVLVDEAYIDFAQADSLIGLISKYNNLIVSQTFSKAWGLAAARVGMAYANKNLIKLYNKVKPPYNVSELNQQAAIKALDNQRIYKKNLKLILAEKKRVKTALQNIRLVKKVYPSDANFLLLEVDDVNYVYTKLINQQIITRNRNAQIANCLRLTIGTPEENDKLLNALKSLI